MFPNSSYPYPYFPSSSSSSPSPYPPFNFLNPENASTNNIFLHDPPPHPSVPSYTTNTHHHHHAPPTCSETFTNWALADAMLKQESLTAGGPHHHYNLSNFLTRKLPAAAAAKKPAKKDRHSKIHTSQGLRDRRVRLSIEIARKFFDLQEMLGFDKASNTLEWLFSKSNKAIEELFRSKHSDNNNSTGACAADGDDYSFSSSSSEDEVVSVKRAQKEKEPSCVQAKMKESREKARARARERTSNKMCPETENSPQMQLQQLSTSEFQPHHELHRDDKFKVFEESIVIKRKLKQSLMSSSHHHQNQNIGIPKEASFNNNNNNSECHSSFPVSPNWDASDGATPRSNICAIASVNLSTGLQIFGKSWEECTSPHLH